MANDSTLSKLIPNYIYFYHLDKFCVLPLYPESIQDRMETSFGRTQALSRSAPVFTYDSSGPRSIAISLKLHRDMMNDINKNVSNLKDNVVDFVNVSSEDYIDSLIKHLQSIALPRYQLYNSGSKSVIPPMIAIRFGDEIFIKGVVNSGVDVTYEKPILVNNKYAQVTVSFSVSEVDPYDADTVAKEGSFRGIFDSRFKGGIYKVNNTSISNPSSNGANSGGNSSGIKFSGLQRPQLREAKLHSKVPVNYLTLSEQQRYEISKYKDNYLYNWLYDTREETRYQESGVSNKNNI